MEDYGASYVVVNKIKSQMMTHTDKNKFNKKVNALQSRNSKAVHSNLQKSRKDLGQTQLPQQKQATSKPGHTISYKDFEKQKKDKNTGEKKELTEWHRITFYRKLAEIAGQYLKKGSQIYVEGRLQTRKWQDKEGVERYTTEIIADTMQMLGGRQGAGGGGGGMDEGGYGGGGGGSYGGGAPRQSAGGGAAAGGGAPRQQPAQRPAPNFSDMDDDIPF